MRHRDNKGNAGLLDAGSVQWMTAGRGIVHSEMPEQEHGLMRGFQLWINLPAKDKMTAPRYQDIDAGRDPDRDAAPGGMRQADRRQRSAVRADRSSAGATEPFYLDVHLAPGAASRSAARRAQRLRLCL